MSSEVVSFLGWIGVLCCTIGYLLVSIGKAYSHSWQYQLLNASGGIFLVISALYNHDTPNTVANAAWAVIGIVSLGRLLFGQLLRKTYN